MILVVYDVEFDLSWIPHTFGTLHDNNCRLLRNLSTPGPINVTMYSAIARCSTIHTASHVFAKSGNQN